MPISFTAVLLIIPFHALNIYRPQSVDLQRVSIFSLKKVDEYIAVADKTLEQAVFSYDYMIMHWLLAVS